jgi:ATP-dependent protease HslVU (ClpYQ) peptidase subunit
MTTIVATASSHYATMASDQGITSDVIQPDMPKIVKRGSWLIGVCGEDRICDVLQYTVRYPEPPEHLIGKATDKWCSWMVNKVVPAIMNAIDKQLGKDRYNLSDSQALLITHGHAFLLSDSLGISKAEPYHAIGSGAQLALGSLAAAQYSHDWNKNNDLHARHAVSIAQMHDPYTRGKISGYKSMNTGQILAI